jgi:hypothetical protein
MTNDDVARALLAYGRELAAGTAIPGIVVTFTPDDAANHFVLKNPNAFLFAVIFDQGIQAERAWAAPYFLSQRLGHFNLERIVTMPLSKLSEVIAKPPALHRYVNNIPDWLKLTAEGRLEEAYEVASATNNMPEICGRICPQDRLCEGNCVIEQSGHGTVTIETVEHCLSACCGLGIDNLDIELIGNPLASHLA